MEELMTFSYWEELLLYALEWFISVVPKLVLTLILFYISSRLIRLLLNRFQKRLYNRYDKKGNNEKTKRITTLTELLKSSLQIALYIIFTLIILGELGFNIGPLLAGAGILGIAVGFGSQELVRDVISGFFIILENQIRVGDVVNINGIGGVVEAIEVRTIKLRDFSQVVHVIQNGKVNELSNMTKGWSAMVFDIGVAYKEDPEQVIEIINEVGTKLQMEKLFIKKIIEPIEIFGLDRFGESGIVIKARIKTLPGDQWAVGREFRKRLKKAFDRQGIEIPFPHRTIYWGEKINTLELEVNKKEH